MAWPDFAESNGWSSRDLPKPIPPGCSYSYEFTAEQHGTYFYHPHAKPDRTQALGLYGALIIDPANPADEVTADCDYVVQIQEWLRREELTYPRCRWKVDNRIISPSMASPIQATYTIHMEVAETLKVRFIGTNNAFIHPMHIHGGPFEVVARDGETIPPSARFLADTVNRAALRRDLDCAPTREMADPLPHSAPIRRITMRRCKAALAIDVSATEDRSKR